MRLEKSDRLDQFLPIIENMCAVDFAISGELVPHTPFHDCTSEHGIPADGWLPFKKIYKWNGFSYCWHCGVPQDRYSSREAPECHRQFGYGRVICPWADFSFLLVYSLWHLPARRQELINDFDLDPSMTYSQFMEWTKVEEKELGKYFNGLEVFLWYCERWLLSSV
jgi:hypothetical protein